MSSVTWVSKSTYQAKLKKASGISLDVEASKASFGSNWVMPIEQDGGSFQSEVSTVVRSAGGITYPSLTFSLPDLPIQWANMAALKAAQGRMRTNKFL